MAMQSDPQEKDFQFHIVEQLKKQGWLVGKSSEYNKKFAIYEPDFWAWIETTQADKWNRLQSRGANWHEDVLKRLDAELENKGTLEILRKGFNFAGVGNITVSQAEPEDERNEKVCADFKANRLTVVPELVYSVKTAENAPHFADNQALNRIDLVFFINGLPVATVELKSVFTQSLEDAKQQYRQTRLPVDKARHREPLLTEKRGAIVHFAMTEEEIEMTTKLDGNNTFFLPFNQGNNGHKGNPTFAENQPYPTAYFWQYVCKPKNWLRIFHSFVYWEEKQKVDSLSRYTKVKRLIFPRYHQFDAVTKMLEDCRLQGVGKNYLFEHSAGSGKTSTIAWTAHSLVRLRYPNGEPYFHSAIVVTDRTVLDAQLQDAIKQLDHQQGLIAAINREDKEQAGKSKSLQLEEALLGASPIIIVTIQTFPFVMEAILTNTSLQQRRFAVIIDEAHNSQTGSTASKLQATLSMQSYEEMENLTVEQLLEKIQQSRVQSKNISHFAFTATPKHSTYSLFGRPDSEGKPQPFHKYTMRQAIEEGFILDVLKGYLPYETAYKLSGDQVDNSHRVNAKQARRTLARWANLHATNVTQKVRFIVEHFHHNVAHLLNGEAKAMIVTSSRPAAVRYKLALDKLLEGNNEYKNYRTLVAFSGKLTGSEVRHNDDHNMPELFDFSDETEFSESSMNLNLPHNDLRKVFDRNEYRVMVVANKFQTGFDQPKLCAMYVDKKIANEVEIVQTYSRLNRTFAGKDQIFIVDFVNKPEVVKAAFLKYDQGAVIENIQDPNIVYNLRDELDKVEIYDAQDLAKYKKAKFDTQLLLQKNRYNIQQHEALYQVMQAPKNRFNQRLEQLKKDVKYWENEYERAVSFNDENGKNLAELNRVEADIQLKTLIQFKSNLAKFSRIYSYIAQLIDFNDGELENFASFSKLLAKLLDSVPPDEVDISGLVLSGYRINKYPTEPIAKPDDKVEEPKPIRPLPESNIQGEPTHLDYLREIIKQISATFGDIAPEDDIVQFINHLVEQLEQDAELLAQIKANSFEIAKYGKLPDAVKKAIIRALSSYHNLADLLLKNSDKSFEQVLEMVYHLIKTKLQ
ncbi:restriction endonuclease [Canicola haemoglobinophilus]|uniref:Type I site-specific restriction-modification system, R subunit n=1 Tax=Canicola haemoglobinophilus TaxID=733 RepID=A0A1V4B2A8_9PAST|nr:DEAD/DEAH box helicase family protein [Canicola haemoglobinophilus]OOS01428.1 restriction endonuclease [Canicola haemoglobinophilus]STO59875.1 type I site-specific restriction-modification system, R subunit [Canicola haemoglobinophilus]